MATNLTAQQTTEIINTISPLRIGTYQAAVGFTPTTDALEIYRWNALISGAFFTSLHVCEVAVRNGIAGVLERKYGPDWPWSPAFFRSLPVVSGAILKPRVELLRARSKMASGATGKVIAELKFAFWCHMLTSRYENRLWEPYLRIEFPFFPLPLTIATCRMLLHQHFESLRNFRNRIAHHEHIFSQPLLDHHRRITDLLRWRCNSSSYWLSQWEIVTATLNARPLRTTRHEVEMENL